MSTNFPENSSLEDKIKQILLSSFHFYKASYKELFFIFWLPFLLLAIVKYASLPFIEQQKMLVLFLLVQVVLTPFLNALMVLFIYTKTQEQTIGIGVLYQTALKLWPSLLAIILLVGGIAYLGFFLLILPGIWVLIRLVIADIIYIVEKPAILDALKLSMSQTYNNFWLIFLSLVVMMLPLIMIRLLLVNVYQALGSNPLLYLVVEIASSFAFLILQIILFRIYMLTRDDRPKQLTIL